MKFSVRPVFYLELEDNRKVPVIDQTDAKLLRYINESGSISKAASKVGLSYRSAWARIVSLEKRTGFQIVVRRSGGKGGGGTVLTGMGVELLRTFRRIRKYIFDVIDDIDYWQSLDYKISARNKIRVKIVKIEKGNVASMVHMKIVTKGKITSLISTQAVEELGIKEGDEVDAIIKATEVIIGKG